MTDTDTNIRQPMMTLNDGRQMPQFGFGTYQIDDSDVAPVVRDAVKEGYRLVDTASIYENERGVGDGLFGLDDIFLTTKIWNADQGEAETILAFEQSLKRLARDSVDLLLIHWPCADKGLYVETWKTLVRFREEGRAKSIGVANFMPDHLKAVSDATGIAPAVNQIELHPYFQQPEAVAANAAHGTITQCWSPLARGDVFDDPVIRKVADAHGAEPAAVILAWELARGFSTIPKAASQKHRLGNLKSLNLNLSKEDVAAIDALDKGEDGRTGPDPETFC